MTVWRTTLGALLLCVMSVVPVHAASLGNIEVRSKLYEPFDARIGLRANNDEELETLRVALADEETFERMGLQRPFLLTTLKFKVVATGERRGYVQITSHERIREPSLTFVVEALLSGGATQTLHRRYDVLLDLN